MPFTEGVEKPLDVPRPPLKEIERQITHSFSRLICDITCFNDRLVKDGQLIAELEIAKQELLLNFAKKAIGCEKLEGSLAEREGFISVLKAEKASLVDMAGQALKLAEECWASLAGERKRRAASEEGLRVPKEAEQELLRRVKQIDPVRIAVAIEDFKISPEQHELIVNAAFPYFAHGTNHILWMLAGHSLPGLTVEMMAEWALADPYSLVARRSHHLVPYNEEELQCLHLGDGEEGQPVWVSPTPLDTNVVSLVAYESTRGGKKMRRGLWELVLLKWRWPGWIKLSKISLLLMRMKFLSLGYSFLLLMRMKFLIL